MSLWCFPHSQQTCQSEFVLTRKCWWPVLGYSLPWANCFHDSSVNLYRTLLARKWMKPSRHNYSTQHLIWWNNILFLCFFLALQPLHTCLFTLSPSPHGSECPPRLLLLLLSDHCQAWFWFPDHSQVLLLQTLCCSSPRQYIPLGV